VDHRRTTLAFAAAALAAVAGAGAAQAVPIPQDPKPSDAPEYVGHPADPQPYWVPRPPQHPHMAADPGNNIHDDAYMTDTYRRTGPLGVAPSSSSTFQSAECATLTFDSQGRVETVCVGPTTPTLKLFDPVTLEEVASYDLPDREPGADTFTDFSGGGYFYLDDQDRAVIPTTSRHIEVVGQTEDGTAFELVRDYDLTSVVAEGDKIMSSIPDWGGRLYFVTQQGVVGLVRPKSGDVEAIDLDEEIANSFAVDESGGVYVVTATALYRIDTGPGGKPQITWREVYENSGIEKPGQVSAGSGTTPTVMGDKWVAITDNADPMNVVVYRRGARVPRDRVVCTVPVFTEGASATENSLIAAGRAIVVTNNYGYGGPAGSSTGAASVPGVTRVDVDRDGRGCHVVWENTEERSPSAVPKLSLANGLVYTVGQDDEGSGEAWYLDALDFRTGELVYKYRYGTGLGYNNNYAPVSLGPDGSAYVGALGGLVRVADETPPQVPDVRPQLQLNIELVIGSRLELTLAGQSREWIDRAAFWVNGERVRVDTTAPYRAVVPDPADVRIRVQMSDGTRVTLHR
jgi:hypothetical protein